MEELTIEQKARLYDEAIKRVENINTGKCKTTFMFTVGLFEYIFPELAESEDEKVRKAIYNCVKWFGFDSSFFKDVSQEECIAWLEKQGKHANFINKIQIGDKVTRNKDGVLVNLSQLERVAKPADKVEMKFKVGDWVIYHGKPYQITGLHNDTFTLTSCDGSYFFNNVKSTKEPFFHLWTIQDAKDGDVLADGNLPFIFKKIDANKYSYAYCGISVDDGFKIKSDGESGEWTWMQDIIPATKEQRNLLFKKMHEAGYEWDAEKKELKKIEQKSSWSEEDENKVTLFMQLTEGCDNDEELADWLKSFRERVQPQPEWSEEDEKMLEETIYLVRSFRISNLCDNDTKLHNANSCIDWLKSLKSKFTWKPSEEQMNGLKEAIELLGCTKTRREQLQSLYEDLNKLREE